MNLYVGEKLTDKNYIHFTLVKGSVKLHLGMTYLPELKKKPQPTNKTDILIQRAVNHLFQAKESSNLQKTIQACFSMPCHFLMKTVLY